MLIVTYLIAGFYLFVIVSCSLTPAILSRTGGQAPLLIVTYLIAGFNLFVIGSC
jgi:hypothetical protein